MNDPQSMEKQPDAPNRDEVQTALFAQLVLQQTNMAMMLMGKVPHPGTDRVAQDLEAARLFIDQLEMIEAKTKGNLSKEEEALLKQSLMSLHLAFVEAVEKPRPAPAGSAPPEAPPASAPETKAAPPPPEAESESKKKFTKRY